MRIAIQAITDELRRLKASGVTALPVSEESIRALGDAVLARAKARGLAPAQSPAATPADGAASARAVPVAKTQAPSAPAAPSPAAERALPPPVIELPPDGDKASRLAWLKEHLLQNPVVAAQLQPGKRAVLGVGDPDAAIMFVGEAPGAEEALQGEPFVGPAGELLTKMIAAMGLKREAVYIGNIMNWRPCLANLQPGAEQVGNRPPTPDELAFCLPFLRAQIEIVRPKLIVALGATAAHGLLGEEAFKNLYEVRGRWHDFFGTPVMVTYHPSYILRNQSNRSKRAIWEDLLKVMERASLPISEKQRAYFSAR